MASDGKKLTYNFTLCIQQIGYDSRKPANKLVSLQNVNGDGVRRTLRALHIYPMNTAFVTHVPILAPPTWDRKSNSVLSTWQQLMSMKQMGCICIKYILGIII